MPETPSDYYLTIQSRLRAPEFKVKGSRFIADIVPVQSKDAVDRCLTEIRKEFYDATHHCFAYRLGPKAELVRAADDGEPTGTAGKPILRVLTSAWLTNTLLVVTRYFGGTKLGTGGLARAYAEAAQQAVSLATVRTVYLTETVTLQVPYDDLAALERMVRLAEGEVSNAVYLDSIRMDVTMRRSRLQLFLENITEEFSGRIGILAR